MNETTKRRALWAASKLTFSTMAIGVTAGATLLGAIACGDEEAQAPVAERDGSQADAKGASRQPDRQASGAATTTPPAKEDPPAHDPPSHEPSVCADWACCSAKVAPILTEEDSFEWEEEKIAAIQQKLGPDGIACCVLLLEYSEEHPDAERSPDHWGCCTAAGGLLLPEHTLACTPWGPPTPPSFDDETLAFALFGVVA